MGTTGSGLHFMLLACSYREVARGVGGGEHSHGADDEEDEFGHDAAERREGARVGLKEKRDGRRVWGVRRGFERGGGARLSQAGMMVHGPTGELDDERSGEKGWSADPGW